MSAACIQSADAADSQIETDRQIGHALRQRKRLLYAGEFAFVGNNFVDGDKRGKRREQVVLQAELRHRLVALFILTETVVIAQHFDAFTCPDVFEGGVAFVGCGIVNGHPDFARFFTRITFDYDLALGVAAPFTHDHDGALGKHVGHVRGLHVVGIETRKFHFYLRKNGRIDVFPELIGRLLAFFGICHDKRYAAAHMRQSFHQGPVDAGTDAEREQVGLIEVVAHKFVGLGFHVDVAVGDNYDRTR